MSEIKNIITREQLIEDFAQEIARLRNESKWWKYIYDNPQMGEILSIQVAAILVLAEKLKISGSVENRADDITKQSVQRYRQC